MDNLDNKINNDNVSELDTKLEAPIQVDYVIQIKDLFKSYGKKEVLKGLNLEVKKGEVFGFIGKNGIGKSLD